MKHTYKGTPLNFHGSVTIYGPSGCGKSTHAATLAKFFGKTRIVDGWTPGGPLDDDTLALTNHPHTGAIDFYDAAASADIKLSPARVPRAITRSPTRCADCDQPQGHTHHAHCVFIPFVSEEAA